MIDELFSSIDCLFHFLIKVYFLSVTFLVIKIPEVMTQFWNRGLVTNVLMINLTEKFRARERERHKQRQRDRDRISPCNKVEKLVIVQCCCSRAHVRN